MRLTKQSGQLKRLIDVPVCVTCFEDLGRRSGEEERLERLGRVASAGAALVTLGIVLIIVPGGFSLIHLAVSVLAALIVFAGVHEVFRRQREKAVLPSKRAILDSARISAFSWRATSFEFRNITFAERFAELNKKRLMKS
jgi:hypothetical protein